MPFVEKDRDCARCLKEHECSCQSHRSFTDSNSLLKHLQDSKRHRWFKSPLKNYCITCGVGFSSQKAFIQHLKHKAIHRHDLHQVACNGRYQIVQQFIHSQYANTTGSSHHFAGSKHARQIGFTPMHCAAFGGHEKALQVMLSWPDGDPNVKDPQDGRTPVHLAAWKGNAACLLLLLKHGGDFTIKDKSERTAENLSNKACRVVIMQHLITMALKTTSPHMQQVAQLPSGSWPRRTSARALHPSNPVADSSGGKSVAIKQQGHEQFTPSLHSIRIPELKVFRRCISITDDSFSHDDLSTTFNKRFSNLSIASTKEENQGGSVEDNDTSAVDDILDEGISCEEQQESVDLPYEVLVRGPSSVAAFNNALKHGKASVSYTQLTIIGDVEAGKTSLVRTLSGEEFREEREETHGIVTSMVEKTDLDCSWKAVDLNTSHVDEILAEKVADDLRGVEPLARTEEKTTSVLQEGLHHSVSGRRPSKADVDSVSYHQTSNTVEESEICRETKANPLEESPVREQEPLSSPLQRDMPYEKISQSLCRGTTEDKANYRKISIWDFAGHPLYQTMHHIFLNRRSFYVVVFSLLKFVEESDEVLKSLRFWLNSVQVHTPKTTPIFLVGTHCKHPNVSENVLEEARRALNEKLAEAFSTHLVRNNMDSLLFAIENSLGSEDEGAVQLKRAIDKEASRMPPEELPIRWLHLEEAIMKQRQMSVGGPCCVTKNDVLEIVKKECGDVDENEFENMLRFYHDNGVVVLPGELIHPSKQHPHLEDKVVLDPQHLVNVMTCLYDINQIMDTERQYKNNWRELEEKGMANKELLKYAWKDFNEPLEDLLVLLEGVGMLCPLEVECPVVPTPPVSHDESTNESHVTMYVIPFHLKEKSLYSRWRKLCRRWKGICAKDKVLIFDFQAFLPPALFPYLLVKMIAESKQTDGINPVISRHMGIFSLANGFYFMLEENQEFHQIRVFARHQHSKSLCELYEKLYNIVADICKEYFRFMKFTSGPPCPNPSCPGASIDGKVLESGSSSESSCEEEEEEIEIKRDSREETRKDQNRKRQHVVQIYPQSLMTPLWCNRTPLEHFAEVREWCEPQQALKVHFERKNKVDMKNISVEQCCMVIVSERLGNKWKKLGRLLRVSDTVIDNIEDENPHNQEERGYKMLQKWKQASTSVIASAKTLFEALKELQCQEIADYLLSHCCKHS